MRDIRHVAEALTHNQGQCAIFVLQHDLQYRLQWQSVQRLELACQCSDRIVDYQFTKHELTLGWSTRSARSKYSMTPQISD